MCRLIEPACAKSEFLLLFVPSSTEFQRLYARLRPSMRIHVIHARPRRKILHLRRPQYTDIGTCDDRNITVSALATTARYQYWSVRTMTAMNWYRRLRRPQCTGIGTDDDRNVPALSIATTAIYQYRHLRRPQYTSIGN